MRQQPELGGPGQSKASQHAATMTRDKVIQVTVQYLQLRLSFLDDRVGGRAERVPMFARKFDALDAWVPVLCRTHVDEL